MRTASLSGTGEVHAGRTAASGPRGATGAPGDLTVTAPRPAAQPHRAPVHATLILAIICVSYFMVILDNSIVFTGLPQIRSDMGFSETGLSWITNAYVLVFGGLLLLGARAGDLFGHRRVFLFSLIVFSLTSLLVGAAQSQWWLIGARALQGVGAAVLAPSALSLLTRSFPEGPARNRAMAAYSAVAGLGAALGLVVGGLVADLISWRAGFFLNVPVGIVMMVLAVRFLPETDRGRGRFDVPGALLATLGSTVLVLGIVDASDLGWAVPATLIPLVVGAVMLGLFVRVERRAPQPIVPLRLFASRERSGAYVTRMLYMGAMMGFFFFTAQFVQSVYHWTPLQAGLAFLPMTLVNFVLAVQVPRLLERHKARTDLGRDFGATDVIAERGDEGIAKVRDLTGGHGTRAVLEAVGHMPAYEMALGAVRPGGVISRVGVPQYEDAPVGFDSLFGPNVTLTGGPAPVRAYIEQLLPAVLEGTVDPGRVFDRALTLEQTSDGYRAMDQREALKVLLTP
ncbi:MFS transporter [Streptomyces sp. NBC_01320]|uniref:MFS transporter n=1 Tax=Streptomyces sp. NBC_01320 TaxID=2903824 RepID=UPI002E10EF61|nr:MFS transporter [Streptomyces sp. NBC_01320]